MHDVLSIFELLTNVALVLVTSGAIYATLRESHRHEEIEDDRLKSAFEQALKDDRASKAHKATGEVTK